MPALFKRIDGQFGTIDIPLLGSRLGEIASWTATRRGDAENNSRDPEADFYDLNAVLSFVPNQALWDDPDWAKEITISTKRGRKVFLVEPVQGPGQRTALNGRNLIMERVALRERSSD